MALRLYRLTNGMRGEGREKGKGERREKGEGRGARTKKQGGAVYLDRTRAARSLAAFHDEGDEAMREKTEPI